MALGETTGTTYEYLDYGAHYFHYDPDLSKPGGGFRNLGGSYRGR